VFRCFISQKAPIFQLELFDLFVFLIITLA
jgi:hypothetical protein